jgi:hypothetical protein
MKRKLSPTEEFQIMKLVLDKFLWLGFGIMAYGLYKSFTVGAGEGFYYIFAGAVVLILFLVVIIREYEVVKFRR